MQHLAQAPDLTYWNRSIDSPNDSLHVAGKGSVWILYAKGEDSRRPRELGRRPERGRPNLGDGDLLAYVCNHTDNGDPARVRIGPDAHSCAHGASVRPETTRH